MPSTFEIVAILLALSAGFGWLNLRIAILPQAAGLMVAGALASLVLVGLDAAIPAHTLGAALASIVGRVDFTALLMDGMLAFLLFAGALHVDLAALRARALPVAALACVGTALSTLVVGFGFWGLAQATGTPVPLFWALAFGALISPTDPVAVMSALKAVSLPKRLETDLQGESLFNDGLGIVLFTIFLAFATGQSGHGTTPQGIVELLVVEAGGGLALGAVTGFLALLAMRAIDDYAVEVLISLALVAVTYTLAQRLHASGPLSVVAAGLLVGDRGPRYAMGDETKRYLFALWTLIDEVLNAVLFLLIGLQVLVLHVAATDALIALAAIPLVLFGRFAGVALALPVIARSHERERGDVAFLTWAGVRGGISVALALSMPDAPAKPSILAATYAVVLFSVILQGATLGRVADRLVDEGQGT